MLNISWECISGISPCKCCTLVQITLVPQALGPVPLSQLCSASSPSLRIRDGILALPKGGRSLPFSASQSPLVGCID